MNNRYLKYKKILTKICLTITSLLFILAVAEILLIMFYQSNFENYSSLFWNHWGTKENNFVYRPLYQNNYQYDPKIGYITKDLSNLLSAKNKKYDLIHLGDSVTQIGLIVNKLNSIFQRTQTINTENWLNAGNVGWGIQNEYQFLKQLTNQKQTPRYLILQIHQNDLCNHPVIIRDKNEWLAFDIAPPSFLPPQFVSRTAVGKLLFEVYLKQSTLISCNAAQQQLFLKYLKKTIALCESNNIKYHLYVFPYLTSKGKRDYQLLLENIFTLNVSKQYVTDLSPIYFSIASSFRRFRMKPNDYVHPNQIGANSAAQKIYSDLVKRDFIK